MAIKTDVSDLPATEHGMTDYLKPGERIFICFVASEDPETKEMWCEACRDAKPTVELAFKYTGRRSLLAFVPVGSKEEWEDEGNRYRNDWGATEIPRLVKYVRGPLEWMPVLMEEEISGADLKDLETVKGFRDEKSDWGY